MEPKHIFKIEEDFENTRLDKWFKKKVKPLPQSLIERTLRKGKILVNGKKVKSFIFTIKKRLRVNQK
jgi:23S rRNA pseudouridine955/2504/2580 synthase